MKGYLIDMSSAPMGYWISYAIAIGSAFGSGFMMLVRERSSRGKPSGSVTAKLTSGKAE